MKIAVSSKGPDITSEVDPRFGRAKYILVVETDSGEVETLDNSKNADALRGAGIQTAAWVADRGATALITGHCGPNAFEVLKKAGIKVANNASGTVKQTIADFLDGKLPVADKADVEGGW
ncbi:MAG: NifB/NifX family molybdenum-iron cluster-binding protein [Deltaproteobacteria bacterium]|nr:NifB/NifX family molybdenum-iron cluster-binding protein [Deltaproteobacteria bacterium]